MPLTPTGKKILGKMIKTHGIKRGESLFYSAINKKVPGSKQWHETKDTKENMYTEALA